MIVRGSSVGVLYMRRKMVRTWKDGFLFSGINSLPFVYMFCQSLENNGIYLQVYCDIYQNVKNQPEVALDGWKRMRRPLSVPTTTESPYDK